MRDNTQKLKEDLIEQFRGKPNIEALVEAVGHQLDELSDFYEQLLYERDVKNAKGTQLDKVGDVVVLTRAEADALVSGGATVMNGLDDETYRRRIMFKILKNTCDCTYADIRKAIDMMWTGPEISYKEDPEHPATLVLQFDASPDLKEEELKIPVIKAGGVGLLMRMKNDNSITMYYGLPLHKMSSRILGCVETEMVENDEPVLVRVSYLTDELDQILTDENGAWLIE